MALTFYYGSGSPFAWKVWLALEHKQISYDFKLLSFQAGDLRTPEFAAVNPRKKVPAIVHDGFALYESSAIVDYLEESFPGPSLWPREAKARAVARRLCIEADLYYYGPARKLLAETLFRPDGSGDPAVIAASRAELSTELGFWERALSADFLAGELSAADFALYPMLAITRRIGAKQPKHSIDDAIGPRMQAWMKRIEALPYAAKTQPPHWKA